MQDDVRKSLITQLKNSFEEDLPDVGSIQSTEGLGAFVSIGDLTLPRNEVYEALDFFTRASDRLSATSDPEKLKRANYCDLAGAALAAILMSDS